MMNHASCARQHWKQITTCDQTEGRSLSTHLDLCVSSVTQKVSQNELRIVKKQRKTRKRKNQKHFKKSKNEQINNSSSLLSLSLSSLLFRLVFFCLVFFVFHLLFSLSVFLLCLSLSLCLSVSVSNLLISLCSSIFAIPIFPDPAVSCAVSKHNKEGLSSNITNSSVRGDDVLDCDVAHHSHVSARLFPSLPFTCESLGTSCFASHRRSDVLVEVSVSVSVSVWCCVWISASTLVGTCMATSCKLQAAIATSRDVHRKNTSPDSHTHTFQTLSV